MYRLFKRHDIRKTFLLDGMWDFSPDPGRKGKELGWMKEFPDSGEKMFVPSCWNNELDYYHYEGVAWYRTCFSISSGNISICFHAVATHAEVYLDGAYLGEHYGGFTPFTFVVTGLEPGEHQLVLKVDNTHNSEDTIPLSRVDWFHYGGIIRSVEVAELSDAWITEHRIDYAFEGGNSVTLSAAVKIENMTDEVVADTVTLSMDGSVLLSQEVNLRPGINRLLFENIKVENVKRWDTDSPFLYMFHIKLGQRDDIYERVGFREVRIENKKIFLNGRELFLRGINRHEEHPDWGFAFPCKLMKKDMDIIKRMGCNAIRGSHYPNSEVFLDLCDQEGILFWEEIPMWGFTENVLKNGKVLERGLKMHEEMINRDYHHPSIIIWGLHNEIDTTSEAGYKMTLAFMQKVRSLDNSRLITYASNKCLEDRCFSLVDIVSVNKYFGWYEPDWHKWPKFLESLREKLRNEGLDNMPVIISEFGGAAIYGDTGFESRKWSEQYQRELLAYELELFASQTDISGMYIWQFCDIRSSREMDRDRARSFNNKGILNEYRKPKLSYWKVEEIYNKLKSREQAAQPKSRKP